MDIDIFWIKFYFRAASPSGNIRIVLITQLPDMALLHESKTHSQNGDVSC